MLTTTAASEPAMNFTHAVMAEVRPMPVPRKPKHPAGRLIVLYVAAVWVCALIWLALSGTTLRAVWATVAGIAVRGSATFDSLIAGGTHALGSSTPSLAAFGVAALAIDAALVLALWLGLFWKSSRVS
ncbi:MAG: hypothetical protein M3R35_04665 [Candidatus Eremiobacteraeota bacterium]|nr:hypothetical protein [Candidatus Eremiobacteraeota bacterium]